MTREGMRGLLEGMFKGWILHENSWDMIDEQYTRTPEECMIEAFGGDELLGYTVYLFCYWSNDIQSIAAHYGISLDREGGGEWPAKLILRTDIPPAPSPEHYWDAGKWNAPHTEEASEEVEA